MKSNQVIFQLFAVALEMGPAALVATVISVIGFVVMFALASIKGDYQGLAKTTLEKDQAKRKQRQQK